jgi:hypothetical protein
MATYAEVAAAATSEGGREYDTIIDRALREADPESKALMERDLHERKDVRTFRVSGREMARRLTAIGYPVAPGTVDVWRRRHVG